MVTEAFTGTPGQSVPLADTLAGCRGILDGAADDWAESSLYMVGTLEDARKKEAAATKLDASEPAERPDPVQEASLRHPPASPMPSPPRSGLALEI
jgi:hypothetical protein